MNDPTREHILLTVLGTNPSPARYVWRDHVAESQVATAALYDLLPAADRPTRVLALCTPDAEQKTLPVLRDVLGSKCPVEPVPVDLDASDDAMHTFLAQLTTSVPAGADLTIDVTHGLRHQSFLTYVGVLYLTALREVRLRAAYYGMLSKPPRKSPFFELRPLVDLPQWLHAVRVLRDTGSAQVLAGMVEASGGAAAEQVGSELRALSEAYASGLPIELGQVARRFLGERVEPLRTVLREQRLPLADILVDDFAGILDKQQLTQELPGKDWKKKARLDREELLRQARIIDSFLDRRDYPNAFGMMREWLVLWAMWRTGRASSWLRYGNRKQTEHRLHALAKRTGQEDTRAEAVVGQVWGHLAELRNRYAHHGYDKKVTLSTERELDDHVKPIREGWQVLRAVPDLSLDLPSPEKRVLVSPIGMRPGVLFSALRAADPDRVERCLVICSAATEGFVAQACQQAGYCGPVELLRLDDPFLEDAELEEWVEEAQRRLRDADEILVNVTGGTTMMGVLADRIATAMSREDRSVHRFALVDRRPPAEQDADPYQEGKACWLDEPPRREEA